MALKVVGAGFGRTGTLSLKLALEQLGFGPCYHMVEAVHHPQHMAPWRAAAAGRPVDWTALFAGYQATVDWPACNYWRQQIDTFPNAKVILTERNPELWHASIMNTIYPSSERARSKARQEGDELALERSAMIYEVIWDGVFAGRMDDKDHVIRCYLAHNQRVKEAVPAERLLVFDSSAGWAPLCGFLGVAQPTQPYPNVNSTKEFRARVVTLPKGQR